MRRQNYGYLPSFGASPLFHHSTKYTLLADRGTVLHAWVACRTVLDIAVGEACTHDLSITSPMFQNWAIQPHLAYKKRLKAHHKPQTAAAAAICVTDRAGVQPIGCKQATCTWDFDLAAKQPQAAQVCHLIISTLVTYVITRITAHLPTLKEWKAELAWLVDLKWTLYWQSGHMSTIDQA